MPDLAQQLAVSVSTIKAWGKAGFLTSYRADDRNTRFFDPPLPGDPLPLKKQGSKLAKRVSIQPLDKGCNRKPTPSVKGDQGR